MNWYPSASIGAFLGSSLGAAALGFLNGCAMMQPAHRGPVIGFAAIPISRADIVVVPGKGPLQAHLRSATSRCRPEGTGAANGELADAAIPEV